MENILGFLACVVSAAMTLYSMKINHRPHPNEWVRLSANKALFVDTEIWIAYNFHGSQNILLFIFLNWAFKNI